MCEEFSDIFNLHPLKMILIQYKFLFLSFICKTNIKGTIKNKMREIIEKHKKLIKTVKEQTGLSDYGMYWLAFLEGGLTVWFLERLLFHWLIL